MNDSATSPEQPARRSGLTRTGQAAAAVFVILGGAAVAQVFIKLKQEQPKTEVRRPVPAVEVVAVNRGDAPVRLTSQGIVEAETETRAAAEVAGRVVWVSSNFKAGGEFNAGDELVRLEDADYKAALAAAKAAEAEARMALELEQARVDQAIRDWNKLAAGTKPESALATRQPQLTAAQAAVASAAASVEKAQRDLDRTVLKAPYTGRIRHKQTDIGTFVTPGTPLADLFSTERYEIRLPVSVDDFTLLPTAPTTPVTLTTEAGGQTLTFSGKVVRHEGEVDRQSRSLYLVAQITAKPHPLLAPGLFLRASIQGVTLPQVARLPRLCLHGQDRVWIIDADQRLRSRKVKAVRLEEKDVLISDGLQDAENVLATVLQVTTEGMTVSPLPPKAQPAP